ncbi:MAG: hypothetical protein Kow006_27820 [Gammaproteobacteria bacterium]
MTSIKTKISIVLHVMALAPLITLGGINYFQTTDIFTQSAQEYLLTIVKSKEDALENYIDATESIGRALANADAIQTYIDLVAKGETSAENARFKEARQEAEYLLYAFQEAHWGKYHHIFLIDRSRRIAISPNHGEKEKGSPSSHLGENTSENRWAMEALERGVTTVSDYSSWVESDHSHQMLFVPVKDASGATQAVIGFELQIPYETGILTEDFRLGETGKVFLTTTDGVPIVYKGIDEQQPLRTKGFVEARATGYSSGLRRNAEGVEVIDLYLKHDKYPWILVAEIETQEAFHNLYSLQTTLLIGLLVTLGIAVLFSLFFANLIVNPIRKLTEQMEKISLGDFDIEIENADRKDEIGKLVQAFQRTVVSLKIAMQHLRAKQRMAS